MSASSRSRTLKPASKLKSTPGTAVRGRDSAIWPMKRRMIFRARFDATTSTQSRYGRVKIICRRYARFLNCVSVASPCDDLFMSIFLAQQQFHEIAPPVDYSFVPTWAIFLASFVGLSIVGLIVWFFRRKRKPVAPPKLPREIALEELALIADEIETTNPYRFSIRVSDILRRYVTH